MMYQVGIIVLQYSAVWSTKFGRPVFIYSAVRMGKYAAYLLRITQSWQLGFKWHSIRGPACHGHLSPPKSMLLEAACYSLDMSPVSPVFHTEATVSIGLKNVLRVGTSIL